MQLSRIQSISFLGVLVAVFLFGMAPNANLEAHSGRTDSNGGHTCRTNCASYGLSTGEYHYHNSGSAPAPKPAPIAPSPTPTAEPKTESSPQPTSQPTAVPHINQTETSNQTAANTNQVSEKEDHGQVLSEMDESEETHQDEPAPLEESSDEEMSPEESTQGDTKPVLQTTTAEPQEASAADIVVGLLIVLGLPAALVTGGVLWYKGK